MSGTTPLTGSAGLSKKMATLALVGLTLAAGMTAHSDTAQARKGRKGAFAAGVLGALAVGAIAVGAAHASPQRVYSGPAYDPGYGSYVAQPVYYRQPVVQYEDPEDYVETVAHHRRYRAHRHGYGYYYAPRRPVCRIVHRRVFDPYYGVIVRPVRVCR